MAVQDLLQALLFGLTFTAGCALALRLKPDWSRYTLMAGSASTAAFCLLAFKDLYLPPPEWPCTLAPGMKAERQIELPQGLARQWQVNAQSRPTWAAAMIDGDQNLDSAQVTINGTAALSSPMAMLDVEQAYPYQATVRDLAASAAGNRGEELQHLRQWRLVPLPTAAVHFDGQPNILTVSATSQALTIYGQYRYKGARDQKLWIPSTYGFSVLRLCILEDSRTIDTIRPRMAQSSSLFNGGGSAAVGPGDLSPDKFGQQNGDYRIYLVLACSDKQASGQPAAATQPPETITFKNFFAEIF
jgi:hypothetical protein